MVTFRNYRRPVLIAAACGALGLGIVCAAGPALAANTVQVTGVGPDNVAVNYSCDRGAGVVGVAVMAGAPQAEQPQAQGTQNNVTCDGSQQSTVVVLQGTPMNRGDTVQVRAALVNANDIVVQGTAMKATLG